MLHGVVEDSDVNEDGPDSEAIEPWTAELGSTHPFVLQGNGG